MHSSRDLGLRNIVFIILSLLSTMSLSSFSRMKSVHAANPTKQTAPSRINADPAPVQLAPDEAVLDTLTAIGNALESEDTEKLHSHIRALRILHGDDYERLIQQLVCFRVRTLKEKRPEIEIHVPGIVVKELDITSAQIVWSLVPLLAIEEEVAKRIIHRWLQSKENREVDGSPDFSHYERYIEHTLRSGNELPRKLIEYMYDCEPSAAVLSVVKNSLAVEWDRAGARSVLWAEHQVSDVLWQWQHGFLPKDQVHDTAREAIRNLADHPQWWARLYVAEVMRQHPPFQTDELITLLATDPDESVRSAILSVLGNNGDENHDDKREEHIEEETNSVPN